MPETRYYTGLDRFRLVAALMVVAIHTAPLEGLSPEADMLLTRVLCRVAVPFFLMVSGFFTVSRYGGTARLRRFVRRTLAVYALAMLLYLPINIYNGYFSQQPLLPTLIFDVLFNGTLYHLWYLPAAVTGVLLARLLVRKLDRRGALAVAALLYLVGLLGDSYFGAVSGMDGVSGFYELIFSVSEYTRNGIFMAPIFVVLGAVAADYRCALPKGRAVAGAVVSAVLMLAEGWLVHRLGWPRHDSMYIMLVPCVWFLFCALLHVRGRRAAWLRDASLAVYLVHPMVIAVLRPVARVLGLDGLLVENQTVSFVVVSAISLAIGVAVAALLPRLRRRCRRGGETVGTDRAFIELDRAALSNNVAALRGALPEDCELMAVVKASAYGHGMSEVAVQLERDEGVRAYAVATIDEGISLRQNGIRGDILILGYTDVRRAPELRRYRLIQTVIDAPYAEQLNAQRVRVRVHIKLDTGMHRLGIPDDDVDSIRRVVDMKYLSVDGIFTHLCCSESLADDDVAFTREQIRRFYALTDRLRDEGIVIPCQHIQSSYGLLNYPELRCSYVRVGIALYGVASAPDDRTQLELGLQPVLSLKARVVLIRKLGAGESVGYDRAYVTSRVSRIAILPIGYADGLPRSLSEGRGQVRIGEALVPIVGKICMDQLAVDVTDAPEVAVGDIATLVDSRTPLLTPEVAAAAGSISNELLSRMGTRLPIVMR